MPISVHFIIIFSVGVAFLIPYSSVIKLFYFFKHFFGGEIFYFCRVVASLRKTLAYIKLALLIAFDMITLWYLPILVAFEYYFGHFSCFACIKSSAPAIFKGLYGGRENELFKAFAVVKGIPLYFLNALAYLDIFKLMQLSNV